MAAAPVLLIAGTVISASLAVAGGVMQAQQAKASAKAEAQAGRFNAAVMRNNQLIRERNAEMERKIGEYNVRQEERRQRFRRSSLTANLAKQGILDGSGGDILYSQLFNDVTDTQELLFKSEIAARREEIGAQDAANQSLLADYGADSAIARGKNAAGAAMFSGITSAISTGVQGAIKVNNYFQTANSIKSFQKPSIAKPSIAG